MKGEPNTGELHEPSNDEYVQYEDGIRKLISGDTVGNKKAIDQGKVLTESTYCHPQHGPNGTARRLGWNGE